MSSTLISNIKTNDKPSEQQWSSGYDRIFCLGNLHPASIFIQIMPAVTTAVYTVMVHFTIALQIKFMPTAQ